MESVNKKRNIERDECKEWSVFNKVNTKNNKKY
jgi:hypothetical protein